MATLAVIDDQGYVIPVLEKIVCVSRRSERIFTEDEDDGTTPEDLFHDVLCVLRQAKVNSDF